MTQQPLFSASKAPRVSDRDVAWMLRVRDGRGWMTADFITFHCAGVNDRTLRAIAAASEGRIISGQKGYARTDQASVEDVNHAAAWLAHQGALMIRRAQEIRQAMHRRNHAA